eukprot:648590_1
MIKDVISYLIDSHYVQRIEIITLLCGKCVYGYSEMTEMYGSSRCEVCTNSTQPSLFLIAIAFGFGLALFTIATKSICFTGHGTRLLEWMQRMCDWLLGFMQAKVLQAKVLFNLIEFE